MQFYIQQNSDEQDKWSIIEYHWTFTVSYWMFCSKHNTLNSKFSDNEFSDTNLQRDGQTEWFLYIPLNFVRGSRNLAKLNSWLIRKSYLRVCTFPICVQMTFEYLYLQTSSRWWYAKLGIARIARVAVNENTSQTGDCGTVICGQHAQKRPVSENHQVISLKRVWIFWSYFW